MFSTRSMAATTASACAWLWGHTALWYCVVMGTHGSCCAMNMSSNLAKDTTLGSKSIFSASVCPSPLHTVP